MDFKKSIPEIHRRDTILLSFNREIHYIHNTYYVTQVLDMRRDLANDDAYVTEIQNVLKVLTETITTNE